MTLRAYRPKATHQCEASCRANLGRVSGTALPIATLINNVNRDFSLLSNERFNRLNQRCPIEIYSELQMHTTRVI